MKKTLLVSALGALFLAACGGSDNKTADAASGVAAANADSKALNIYIWSDYVDPDAVKAFSEKQRHQSQRSLLRQQ